jgi:prepilin-type N-terminal cleavage/methylation domain-containing protein
MKENKQGFSVIEVTIVLSLIGLLLLWGGFSFSILVPRLRLEGAAQDLISDLQLARMKAIAQNCFYRLHIEPDRERYVIERESLSGTSRWPGTQEGLTREWTNPDSLYHHPGVDLVSSSHDPVFSPRGTAFGTTLVISIGEIQKIVAVSSQGRVRVQ